MTVYTTKEQVHNRACEAVGKTIGELAEAMEQKIAGKKAQVGYAWESWFGIKSNSHAEADIADVEIELKATGVKNTKNGKSAKERLVLNIINYIEEFDKTFEKSSFWRKNRYMELGFYGYDKEKNWQDWNLEKVALFTYPEKDLKIIQDDWEKIHEYIHEGKAHELSEGMTMYLGACSKGANKNSKREQHPSLDAPKAMQRAYSLKSSYMTYLLREYIYGNNNNPNIRTKPFLDGEVFEEVSPYYTSESIISDVSDLENQTIEQYITKKMARYIGKSVNELIHLFNIQPSKEGKYPKSINAVLASRMLGLCGDLQKSEEFFKANVAVKTIRVSKDRSIKESMSFPTFKFKEIVKEKWEESTLRDILDSSKFFFVVFKENNDGEYIFSGTKFWSMPELDIENIVQQVWLETVNIIKQGVCLTYKSNRVLNNFIKASEGRIVHVRPHAKKASYVEGDSDADELPVPANWMNKPELYADNWMTKQSFWLNNKYVLEQIKDLL